LVLSDAHFSMCVCCSISVYLHHAQHDTAQLCVGCVRVPHLSAETALYRQCAQLPTHKSARTGDISQLSLVTNTWSNFCNKSVSVLSDKILCSLDRIPELHNHSVNQRTAIDKEDSVAAAHLVGSSPIK